MATPNVTGASRSVEYADIKALLPVQFWSSVTYQNGNLNVNALRRLLRQGHDIPQEFVDALNQKYPALAIQNPEPVDDPPTLPGPTASMLSTPLAGDFDDTATTSARPPPVPRSTGDVPPPPVIDPENLPVNVENVEEGTEDNTTGVHRTQDQTRNADNQNRHPGRTAEFERRVRSRYITDIPDAYVDESGRRFTWMLTDLYKTKDLFNERNADGTLKDLTSFTGPMKRGDDELAPYLPTPKSLLTDEFLEACDIVRDVNGGIWYDSEKLALGSLQKKHYMLIPNNWPLPICKVEDIGGGLEKFPIDGLTTAAIYNLAKQQALSLEMGEEKAIKWAVLRLEAYKGGWFDKQKYTMYKRAPDDSVDVFIADRKKIGDYLSQAYTLCSFIPFLAEFQFRAYGSSYNQNTAMEYQQRAEKLGAAAQVSDMLNYLDRDTLYGTALSWIEVKRPMQALQCASVLGRISHVFHIRKKSAPAGQAIVTTSAAVIKSLMSANWWAGIKHAGGYLEGPVITVADQITANPWKYHIMHRLYGVEGPSDEEKGVIEEAREKAILYAPILQAYVDVVAEKSDLGRSKALKKPAAANNPLYDRACTIFRRANRRRGDTVASLFANEVFQVPSDRIEG